MKMAEMSSYPPHNSTSIHQEDNQNKEEDYYYEFYKNLHSFKTEYFITLRLALYIIGWVGNFLNIRTFLRMGLADSMTIVFFNLAVADFNFINSSFVETIAWICEYLPLDILFTFKVHPKIISQVCGTIFSFIFVHATVYLTTFLAIQRCLCVIKPLHFSGMFTRFRTYVIVSVIWVCSISINVVFFGYTYIREARVPYNRTWITLEFHEQWGDIIVDFTKLDGVIYGASQSIVVICIFVMARALAKSAKFRHSASSSAEAKLTAADEKSAVSSSKAGIPNSKERRAIIQVSIVATLFIISYINPPILDLLRLNPNVDKFFREDWVHYEIYFQVCVLLRVANSSANFFVYYKYNKKFKQYCFKK